MTRWVVFALAQVVALSGCALSELKKESAALEAAEDACAAFDLVNASAAEHAKKKAYWTLWAETAERCGGARHWSRWQEAMSAAYELGMPIDERTLPILALGTRVLDRATNNQDDYPVEVYAPTFVTSVQFWDRSLALTDGTGKVTLSQALVKARMADSGKNYTSTDTELQLFVGADTYTVRKDLTFGYPYLRTGNPSRLLCHVGYRVEERSSQCYVAVEGPVGTEFRIEEDNRPLARCMVDDLLCLIGLPARLYNTGAMKLVASRPGYRDESKIVDVVLAANPEEKGFYANACWDNQCSLSYRELEADAGAYRTKLVRYSGRVLEIQRDGSFNFMRIAVGGNGSTDMAIAWTGDRYGLLRGTYVTVWGVVEPNFSYETVAGWKRTIPRITPVTFEVGRETHFLNLY